MTPLEVAISQIGYTESPAGSNKTKYGSWYGMNGVPWCMIFVQWCFAEAGTPLPYQTASCSDLLDWYRKNEPARIVSEPKTNDVVIYTFGHTGIVERADAVSLTAIEGNTSLTSDDNGGAVMRRTRPLYQADAFIRPVSYPAGGEKGIELPMLRKGSGGDTVRALQYLLLGWGYDLGRWGADGDFGADTEKAVKKYQWQHGLEDDGIVGPLTWTSLLGM